jgi:hypothetical protein
MLVRIHSYGDDSILPHDGPEYVTACGQCYLTNFVKVQDALKLDWARSDSTLFEDLVRIFFHG